ncbi:MAG: rhomboid family intramembrane serine protease [Candidatus Acidiferrales bacterium]
MALPLRWQWKLDRFREKAGAFFGGKKEPGRPRLCPSCGTLVGASATRCHQCGASMTYSLAAASRSLSRLMPTTSPMTYAILTLSCLLYAVSLVATIRLSGGLQAPPPGLGGLFNFGGINGSILQLLGASDPLPTNLVQPWRFVMAIFLHGSLLHIGFNMWVLMDVGPLVEEVYGSARYLFIYVATGIGGYLLSSSLGNFSVGGSGALLGLIGVLLALTAGRKNASLQMLRSNIIRWLIYIAIMGLFFHGIDNYAHFGGCVTGYILGKVMDSREPVDAQQRKLANVMGWGTAAIVAASFAAMAVKYFAST